MNCRVDLEKMGLEQGSCSTSQDARDEGNSLLIDLNWGLFR